MDPYPRYEIVDALAQGEFATVYRARDRELGREVAVKQIHPQYLADPRQLARYWHEAQLLANLQHPHIVTIYDIVRPRGWLILELMRGSLQKHAQGEPIDLDALRTVLFEVLSALQFLHVSGVVHGDVKPSNLMLDARGRVKLGDFGLARRVNNENGSLMKGTTKYMAPEVAATQFGPIGPASDLYSLGIVAYELMCGSQFESLFPTLSTLGKNRQIAWMIWHTTADLRLPEIPRVLQGVPSDLARVIQRLVQKDQSLRYRSADEALQDLQMGTVPPPPPPAAPAAAPPRGRRALALGAFALSVVLSLVLAFWPSAKAPPPAQAVPAPDRGVVRDTFPDERLLVIESADDGSKKEYSIRPRDRVFLNQAAALLRDLHPGDDVTLRTLRDEAGIPVLEIHASRPVVDRGHVASVQADEGTFTLAIDEGNAKGQELNVAMPAALEIVFNGKLQTGEGALKLADLKAGDRVEVEHRGTATGREATRLTVQRVVEFSGVLREVADDGRSLTAATGEEAEPVLVTLPVSDACEVTLNDRRVLNQQVLKVADLAPGDRVRVAHDVKAVRIDAYRVLGQLGVVEVVDEASRVLRVTMKDASEPTSVIVTPQCEITLAGEVVELGMLRKGDRVDIAHDTPGAERPEAKTITAVRPADPARRALVIGIQDYEDLTLGKLAHTVEDARMVRDALVKRYAVPEDQAVLLTDESLVRLEQAIPPILAQAKPGDTLIVYFAGHAYRDTQGKVYLAPKNFSIQRMETTGLALQWLVDQLEACPAKEKLLLWDASHGDQPVAGNQPSAVEMLRALHAPPGQAALRTVTALASSAEGQTGQAAPSGKNGLFAWALSQAYAGAADKDRNLRIEPTELDEYLQAAMRSAAPAAPQTPVLLLPDNRPPRLSAEARDAIVRLAAVLQQGRIDSSATEGQYSAAVQLAGSEPEPKILYGLVLLKQRDWDAVLRHFQELKLSRPQLIVPRQAIATAWYEKRFHQSGVEELLDFMTHLPANGPAPSAEVLEWMGRMREFAASAAESPRAPSAGTLAALDAAVAKQGDAAGAAYSAGREKVREVAADFDRQIASASSEADALKLRLERRRLTNYAPFPFDQTVQEVLAGMTQ